jgi:hypothetical protein
MYVTWHINLCPYEQHAQPKHNSQCRTQWRVIRWNKRFIDFLTLEIWTPRFLCTPEHSMQSKIPKFKDAQSGSAAPQSAQKSFPGTRCRISKGFSCGSRAIWAFRLRQGAWSLWELLEWPFDIAVSSTASMSVEVALNVLLSLGVLWWLPLMGLRYDLCQSIETMLMKTASIKDELYSKWEMT